MHLGPDTDDLPNEGKLQAGGWSTPINLAAGIEGRARVPVIVADDSGGVHVFWDEDIRVEGGLKSWVDYTYWDGQVWSGPLDVFVGSESWKQAWGAQAVADRSGTLHTIWIDGSELMYAQRTLPSPVSARSWTGMMTLPTRIGHPIGPAEIALDDTGGIHVVYLHAGADQPGVYYLRSDDGGITWDSSMLLSDPELVAWPTNEQRYVADVLVAGDSVHAVWQHGYRLYYSRSDDWGVSWNDATIVNNENVWPSFAQKKDGQLLLLSTGTIDGAICLKLENQQLNNSEQSWTKMNQIVPQVKGCLGKISAVRDGDGRLNLITSARENFNADVERIWYSQKVNEEWVEPELVSWPGTSYSLLGTQPDFPSAAISSGNILHVVFQTDEGAIWYTRRTLYASSIPLVTFSQPAVPDAVVSEEGSSATTDGERTASSSELEQPSAGREIFTDRKQVDESNMMHPAMAGTIAGLVVIGGILVLSLRRQRTSE